MANKKFHCDLCKDVGGKDGVRYRCATHQKLCSSCVVRRGFWKVTYRCAKCDGEVIEYRWNEQRQRWVEI